MAAFAANKLELDLSLEHELDKQEDESAFGALVAANHKWLGHYARMHATFSVEQTLLERNSIWMNSYFQKNRMITSPWSKEGGLDVRDLSLQATDRQCDALCSQDSTPETLPISS